MNQKKVIGLPDDYFTYIFVIGQTFAYEFKITDAIHICVCVQEKLIDLRLEAPAKPGTITPAPAKSQPEQL
ncbi:MAG: hypothetical protein IAE96_04775 [Chitinophagaceae bacterium]|nr:hypothetical protein [Chitinophagaceae bacterium]